MVYTLTVNPSVDYILNVPDLKKGYYNRTSSETMVAGGRGVNVCRTLSGMGVECIALGFVGGIMGQLIKSILNHSGIRWSFVEIDGETRVNIKVQSNEYETLINARGPEITQRDIEKMFYKLDMLTDVAYLFLSGSVRQPALLGLYKILGEAARGKNAKLIVDSDGNTLKEMLVHKPFFIKPTIKELGIMFDTTIVTMDAVMNYGKKAVALGAEHVIVSLDERQAPIYFGKAGVYKSTLPPGKVMNTNGVGETMVGAFVGEYINSAGNIERSFQMSVAAGAATSFTSDICTYEEMQEHYNFVTIEKIE